MGKEEAVKINIESGDNSPEKKETGDNMKEKEKPEDIREKENPGEAGGNEKTLETAGKDPSGVTEEKDTKGSPEGETADEAEDKETAGGDETAGDEEAGDETNKTEGKKKHFGKKNKKDPRDEKIADLEDRVKRQMAEFENFRKRTDREKSQMFDMGAKSVIEKILPVIDNFERGLESVPEECDEAFADGMRKIYRQMTDELEKIGVRPIEAVGQPFDPNFHNAVMQTESEEYESGTVAQELQKGYMYHDTLVRPSMVAVVS